MENLEPKEVIKHFLEISKIPRESGNEKEISDFLVKFAKERGLEVIQDKAMNVIIKKPGTKAYENSSPVIIQGHMDMVCEKTPESKHDFLTDPIEVIHDGDYLKAKDTTLGADNGIAVAMAMAILDSKELEHPPIEVLITSAEETGMDGALAVDGTNFKGKTLLNIDTDNEGVFIVSCAGGANVESTFKGNKIPFNGEAIKISISNYSGGHSGVEIHKQKGNAISHLGRLIYALSEAGEFYISTINGGSKHNAIALSSDAIISVRDSEKAIEILEGVKKNLLSELVISDPDAEITFEKIESPADMYDEKLSKELATFLFLMPQGVQGISLAIDNLVETSLNQGVLRDLNGTITLETSVRGSQRSAQNYLIEKLISLTKLCGGEAIRASDYPAWEYELNSKVREKAVSVYKRLYGEEPEVNAIHAGLECGILKGALPDCDMISFGPTQLDAHTYHERVSISSLERVWNFTKELLKELK
ncbi:MAG: aminoacyl-histidine dipeptidase [Tissierellia bacterium]|nr:aminoacyl-histidine dipeptidase [Tissierellia bacterium]